MNRGMVFGYEREAFVKYGITIPIKLEISTYPHMLLTGASGSGKSQTLLFLIGKLLQYMPDIVPYICDFKNSHDFDFLSEYPYYYTGQGCYEGIMDYYHRFSEIRENRSLQGKKRYLLICDEYPALVNYLQMKDKSEKTKFSNEVLNAIAEILMLGRGISCGCWLLTQRPDAMLFSNGARDNFMLVIALSSVSKEQKSMVFAGQELPDEILGVGEGVLLADGREIVTVKYPFIEDAANWKQHILQILMHESHYASDADA